MTRTGIFICSGTRECSLRVSGESVIRSHEGLRAALADAGFTFDPSTGKVVKLEAQAELLSKRREQVQANLAVIENQWRENHHGREPTKEERKRFDFQAWALGRPGKKTKTREVSQAGWIQELRAAGLQVEGFTGGTHQPGASLDSLDRQVIAD